MKGTVKIRRDLTAKRSLALTFRMIFLFASILFLCDDFLNAQCPNNEQTKVFNANRGTGFFFYKFLGESSFRYFLDGKTFSLKDKDDPGRTFVFIDDMTYELILEDKADFASYIKGSKPIDILRAQAKYEQDHYKKLVPSVVITDYGPPSNANPESDDRLFYLWKKENPPGMEAATQYLVSTLVKNRVVLLSIMLTKASASESDVFSQLQKYTGSFVLLSSDQCSNALAKPTAP
ncbi:MAG: hypothetical protein ABR987_15710 [Terracidiphilus sp.]